MPITHTRICTCTIPLSSCLLSQERRRNSQAIFCGEFPMTMGAELQPCSKSCPQVVVGSISTTAWLLWLKKQPQVEQLALQFQAQNTVNKLKTGHEGARLGSEAGRSRATGPFSPQGQSLNQGSSPGCGARTSPDSGLLTWSTA